MSNPVVLLAECDGVKRRSTNSIVLSASVRRRTSVVLLGVGRNPANLQYMEELCYVS